MKKILINLGIAVLVGLIIGWLVIRFLLDPMVIKKEALYCQEQGGDSSAGKCRVVNTHAAYLQSKNDINVTLIFYRQGPKNPLHVIGIYDNKIIDKTSDMDMQDTSILFDQLKKDGYCIVYKSIINNKQIIDSDINTTCDKFAYLYKRYVEKSIEYKNDNPSVLETSACNKISPNKGEN